MECVLYAFKSPEVVNEILVDVIRFYELGNVYPFLVDKIYLQSENT